MSLLPESHEFRQYYLALLESFPAMIWCSDTEGQCNFFNHAWLNFTGRTMAQELGDQWADGVHPDDLEHCLAIYRRAFQAREPFEMEYRLRRHDGAYRWIQDIGKPSYDPQHRFTGYIGFCYDVTQQKADAETLRATNERLRAMIQASPLAIIAFAADDRVESWNASATRMFGWTEAEVLGHLLPIVPPDLGDEHAALCRRVFAGDGYAGIELRRQRKDGALIDVHLSAAPIFNAAGEVCSMLAVIADTTERKQIERALSRELEENATIADVASRLLSCSTIEETAALILDHATRLTGSALGSMGHLCPDTGALIPITTLAQDRESHRQAPSPIPPKNILAWLTSHRRAFLRNAPDTHPLHSGTPSKVPFSLLAVPSLVRGSVIGYIAVAAAPHGYTESDLALVTRLAALYAIAIEHLQIDGERQRSIRKLQQLIDDSIQAITKLVQIRDPYTAGHEQRVSDLAGALAGEMGLNEDQLSGIRVAALLHDVGKMYVPAEILTKPGKLSEIELLLVKMHAQAGHDILSSIDFPWPVAPIVLQHHERLDGSGYPFGLCGDEIQLEAKILAVADVVESMVTHRPYRAALSREEALDEISRNRGILYDARVVDACLTLFLTRNFSFRHDSRTGTTDDQDAFADLPLAVLLGENALPRYAPHQEEMADE